MEEIIEKLNIFLLANIPEIITQEEFVEVKQAIENLIKEYKELEEKVNKYEKQIDLEWVEENYIEKSKVREKIEIKYRQAKGLYEQGVLPRPQYTMKLLTELKEELLQEGDK